MSSDGITRHDWYRVVMEPGDATHYEFQVTPLHGDYRVSKLNGAPFTHTFPVWFLESVDANAPLVRHVGYDGYRAAVHENTWLNEKLFPVAVADNLNPWSFLAAALAALAVHDQLFAETP